MTYGTMERIQTVTVGSGGAATIAFSNIPQTYDDLQVVFSTRLTTSGYDTTPWVTGGLLLNSTTANSARQLFGTGSSTGSDTNLRPIFTTDTNGTASTFSNGYVYIPNYRSSTNKSASVDVVTENNGTASAVILWAGLYTVTSAVTALSLVADSGDFAQHSTATLYGITRVPAGAKATGGVIYDDSSYWYHVFTSSGTFTPSQSFSADVLVVAGGGGGGSGNNSGGGGAGGLLAFTSQSLTAQNYTVTVGAGGATGNPNGVVGSDSQFGSLTLVKGGGLGAADTTAGGTGGSGGGNGFNNTGTAGQPTTGQGFAGGPGQGNVAPDYFGGGGGGAGEAGNTDAIGQGGDGVSTYSSWGVATSTGQDISGTRWFAGGGGGSGQSNSVNRVGGDGGGGRGAGVSGAAQAGTANTGGGGGGSGNSAGNTGAAGGSGIVIVRYAK